MWAGLSVALALCVLGGCSAESEPDGARCKAAAEWKIGETEPLKESLGRVTVVAYLQASCLFCLVQASKLDSLRLKLEQLGYANITYMVVNSQDETSRRLHPLLAQRISESITLYGQDPEAPDVWQISNAMKDDFQIYDRCGRLTHHLSLPYTILSEPYVEQAIRSTYCDGICGECTMESSIPQECNTTAEEKPEGETPRAEEEGAGHRHSPGIGHGHHGHQGGHHGHHGHHHGHQRGQHRGHHDSGGRHSHDVSDHQHGHQGQVVSQVQRGQVDSGHTHPQVAHKHVDLGQVGLRQVDLGLDFDQVEARNPPAMQQP